jgi:YD repeat-containing protein
VFVIQSNNLSQAVVANAIHCSGGRMPFRRLRPWQINVYRSVCYTLCLALILSSLPWSPERGAQAQGNPNQPILSRALPPHYALPKLDKLLEEGKTKGRPELPRPPLKPSTLCGYRDRACQGLKKERERIGQNAVPQQEQHAPPPAKPAGPGWLNRVGQKLASVMSGSALRALAAPAAAKSLVAPAPEQRTAVPPARAARRATAFTPPPLTSLTEARLDPRYRTGGAAEDLFSGNMHWSLPLVSLPGRGGLDLNLTLHYNSLVWAKYTNTIEFEYDYYPTLTVGFRLGFPELEGPLTVRYVNTYIAMLPSGRRVEMRQVGTNRYEAIDSSYLYLVVNPTAQTATLYGTDGTQWHYAVPANGYQMRCVKVVDANGNYLTIDYKTIGNPQSFYLVEIDKVTDTVGRVVTFNYDANLHLQSITQNWGGQTFTWAQFDYGSKTIQTNFGPNLTVYGPGNNSSIPVINRVITSDGARHTFVYNTWGQVQDIFTYGEADNVRAALDYEYPSASNTQLSDCPRFFLRNDYIVNWAGATGGGWATTNFYFEPSEAYGEMTLPNGVTYRELFSTTNGTRGLTTRTETLHNGVSQQFTEIAWASDSTSSPPLLPRRNQSHR